MRIEIQVHNWCFRDAAISSLQPHDPAAARRNADRAANVGSGAQGGCAGCQRSARSPRGTTRCVVQIVRVAGDAPDFRLAGAQQTELRGGGAGMHDHTGVQQPLGKHIGLRVNVIFKDERAASGAPPCQFDFVFDDAGQTIQGSGRTSAAGVALFRCPGLLECFVVIGVGKCVDRRLNRFCPIDLRLHNVDGGKFARPELLQGLARRHVAQIEIRHCRGRLR